MTPRQENSIERSVGRIEAQLEALAEAVKPLSEMRADIVELKRRADLAAEVTEKFTSLDQSIRDGKNQAKGVVIGVGIAGGAAGATAATGLKWLWAAMFGA